MAILMPFFFSKSDREKKSRPLAGKLTVGYFDYQKASGHVT